MTATPLAYLRAALDAAEKVAEAAKGTGDGNWTLDETYGESSRIEDKSRRGRVIVYDEGAPDEDEAAHIVRHDPAAVLRRIKADRALQDALDSDQHFVSDDEYSTCMAASVEHDGGEHVYRHRTPRRADDCTCGRDDRVREYQRLLAEGWGWRGET